MLLKILSKPYRLILLTLTILKLVKAINSAPTARFTVRQDSDVESESIEALTIQHLHKTVNNTNDVDLFLPESYQLLKLEFSPVNERQIVKGSKAVLTFLNQPDKELLRAGVEEVDVRFHDRFDDFLKTEVKNLLLRAVNLKIIRWNVQEPIFPSVLRHLERHNPLAKIYYSMPLHRFNDAYPNLWGSTFSSPRPQRQAPSPADVEALQSIMYSANLHSLEANVMYGSFANQDSLRVVFQTLSTCPNIKELELSITKPRLPQTVFHGQPDYFDFRSNPSTKFPTLEVLKLSGYNLDSTSYADWDVGQEDSCEDDEDDAEESQSLWTAAQQRFSRATSSHTTNVEEWLRVMDWSELHTLHLDQPSASTLRSLKGAIPQLQHLDIAAGSPNDGSASIDFATNTIQPLETLSLVSLKLNSLDKLINRIIRQHHSSLKHLTINGRHKSQNIPLVLNAATISHLFSQCPSLQSLSIDIASTPAWDYPLLQASPLTPPSTA